MTCQVGTRAARTRKVTAHPGTGVGELPVVYKAVADEANGEVQVKAVNVLGEMQGDTVILKVIPL